jgi:DNA polymerase-3 subunit delta'
VLQPDAVTRREESLLSRFAARYLADSEEKKTKPSAVIAVDQVRELTIAAQGRPQIARCRVMVLAPAESLNHSAANSLLKLLEEPPADTHLLLVSHEAERLLPTIRSRCSRVTLPLPARSEATTWLASAGLPADRVESLLALAGGAPLLAVNYFKDGFLELRGGLARDLSALAAGEGDPVGVAGQWKSHGALRCLGWFQTWLHDLAVLAGAGGGSLYNPDQQARLQTLLKALNLIRLFRFSDIVAEATRQAEGPLDEQLLLEDVLIRWTRLCSER